MGTDPELDWQAWRSARNEQFADPYGWLSLTALHWLDDAPSALDGLPGLWWADDKGVHHDPAGSPGEVRFGGRAVTAAELLWNPADGRAPQVTHGDRRLELIDRGWGLSGIRVRDPRAEALQAYDGVPAFSYDPAWRVTGRYRRYDSARQVVVGSVASRVQHSQQVTGEIDLVVGGIVQTLKVTGGDGWLVAFHDASNGAETTRHCRWIELDQEPDDDVVVDFNRAANPPCAFTDYGTCPLPPAGNTIPVPVLAGERDPRRA
ncbi:MAG: DUF1684 domain-containing protein [Propionicimonas sp.]|nr:DUF1684 domain-containing protein [Propionicimonas sp.]